ncbi:hypothetical protein [Kitasatospora sp. NPDC088134]|uniref:hypothetical protein n=1 Tax=Kitasatospora sp. NPDC088134 TaxID=3364071 RepID=UPI003811CF76
MRTPERTAGRRRPPARAALAAAALTAVLTTALLLTGTGPAAAADPSIPPTASAAPTAGAAPTAAGAASGAGRLADSAPQAERLAAELRRDPVWISPDIPRQVPRSLAPQFAALAARTGVPTYVLVLPDADASLLALVHDQLGRDGLYVLVQKYGGVTVSAFGVNLPTADDARRIANHVTPYDAGPTAALAAFVDALALSPDQAAAKARALSDHDDYPDGRYISATDRQNQNLLLGNAIVVIPGLVLALGLWLASRRRRSAPVTGKPAVALTKGPAKAVKSTKNAKAVKTAKDAKPPVAPAGAVLRSTAVLLTLAATVAAVFAVVLAAPKVFPQTVDGPDLDVTKADLHARIDEAGAAFGAGNVYQDASVRNPFTPAELAAVQQRITALAAKTPVYLLFTPSGSDDESGGDGDTLLYQTYRSTGREGVYVQVDPGRGYLQLAEFRTAGTDVESRFGYSDRYPDRSAANGDLQLPNRLNRLLDAVDAAKATGKSNTGRGSARAELPEVAGNRLPPLFSSDFGPGITLGALLLLVLLLLAWGLIAAVRAVVRRRRARAEDPSRALPGGPPRHTEAQPTVRQLRLWAAADVQALAALVAAAEQDAPGRATAWDCLDAAELLLGDGRQRTAAPGDLAAAAVLARAGADALQGQSDQRLCRLNPLHGGATGGKAPSWFAEAGLGPAATARLCPDCHAAFRRTGAHRGLPNDRVGREQVDRLLLRLPGADDRSRTGWSEAGEILPAALDGLDALVLRARESASVQ